MSWRITLENFLTPAVVEAEGHRVSDRTLYEAMAFFLPKLKGATLLKVALPDGSRKRIVSTPEELSEMLKSVSELFSYAVAYRRTKELAEFLEDVKYGDSPLLREEKEYLPPFPLEKVLEARNLVSNMPPSLEPVLPVISKDRVRFYAEQILQALREEFPEYLDSEAVRIITDRVVEGKCFVRPSSISPEKILSLKSPYDVAEENGSFFVPLTEEIFQEIRKEAEKRLAYKKAEKELEEVGKKIAENFARSADTVPDALAEKYLEAAKVVEERINSSFLKEFEREFGQVLVESGGFPVPLRKAESVTVSLSVQESPEKFLKRKSYLKDWSGSETGKEEVSYILAARDEEGNLKLYQGRPDEEFESSIEVDEDYSIEGETLINALVREFDSSEKPVVLVEVRDYFEAGGEDFVDAYLYPLSESQSRKIKNLVELYREKEKQFLEALYEGDEEKAASLFKDLKSAGISVEDIFFENLGLEKDVFTRKVEFGTVSDSDSVSDFLENQGECYCPPRQPGEEGVLERRKEYGVVFRDREKLTVRWSEGEPLYEALKDVPENAEPVGLVEYRKVVRNGCNNFKLNHRGLTFYMIPDHLREEVKEIIREKLSEPEGPSL